MTEQEFREDSELRAVVAAFLDSIAGSLVVQIIKERHDLDSVPLGLSPIDIGRAFEARLTRLAIVEELKRLAEPLETTYAEAPMTFGTGHSVEEFDQPLGNL